MTGPQLVLAMLTMAACATASAQVYKCPDPVTKKVTYSDAPCTDGKQIVRQMTDEERALSAERANIARERIQLERDRAALRQQQDAPRAHAPQAAAAPAINQFECQKAKREAAIASNMNSGDNDSKRRRMNRAIIEVNEACGTKTELLQEPPKIFVQPRRGAMTCHGAGATMVCN